MNSKTDFLKLKDENLERWVEDNYLCWSLQHKCLYNLAEAYYDIELNDPIKVYSGNLYRQMNTFLRDGFSEYPKTKLKYEIDLLRLTILSSPVIADNIIVYRWENRAVFLEMCKTLSNGIPFRQAGFLSTTFKPFAEPFERYDNDEFVLLKLYIPKGTHAVYTDLVARHGEYELIFLDGLYMRLQGEIETYEDTDRIVRAVDVIDLKRRY